MEVREIMAVYQLPSPISHLPTEEYEEILEDLHDLAVIAERREEPTLSFEELKNKLKADGLL